MNNICALAIHPLQVPQIFQKDLKRKQTNWLTLNQFIMPMPFFSEWRVITSEIEIQNMQWSLIPNWYKGTNWIEIASKTANAKIETAHEKASYKFLLSGQRCIIPSNGFFEWQHVGKLKRPYFIYPTHETMFSMAGIYDLWTDLSTGETKNSFSILTTKANEL